MRTTLLRGALAGAAAVAAAVLVATSVTAAVAAQPILHGTYTTPTAQGTLTYTPLRAFRGGSEGRFVVSGRGYPGSMYAAVGGGTGLAWYYGVSGIMAGNALVRLQPDGTYAGSIWFFDRAGDTIDTGTIVVTFP